ncbi:unnamed protein product [Mytilus coruscus]|uniref:Endonuclease/exonuclease/phosphatase domain-containing protein n=1 Tax=Mytilus coruscus TaxID=42192 RepID=A0A6J8ABI6_MYTCO|nr:unnamed protein product [Mytilus coruscus]
MREDLLDTQIKSNIENLVFYNIPEKDDEDCLEESLLFCEKYLKMQNVRDSIQILRANRMSNRGVRIRPILVKFGNYKQREEVRKNDKNLKDTQFGISEELPEYCNKGRVFVCGDFNSRTGLINVILPSDNLDRYIDVIWHDEIPNIPTRGSMDTIANRFANGRSVIDYMCVLASPNDYEKISYFGILNINEFSDHSPLVFEVGIKTVTEENLPKVSSFIKWDKDKVEENKTKLNLHKNVMTEIDENLQQVNDANGGKIINRYNL